VLANLPIIGKGDLYAVNMGERARKNRFSGHKKFIRPPASTFVHHRDGGAWAKGIHLICHDAGQRIGEK
jgi:hypothetical protein